MHTLSLGTLSSGTLSPAFSPVPSSPLSVSALASPRIPQHMLPSTLSLSSSLFSTPTGSPFPPALPNKLAVGVTRHLPGKQSVSLGRAMAAGADGSPGLGRGEGVGGSRSGGGWGTNGSGSVPRQNLWGDLKIPTRISQAQVGLQRDLGMVREFAMNIERKFFFSLSFGFMACLLTRIFIYSELRELQQTYQALVLALSSRISITFCFLIRTGLWVGRVLPTQGWGRRGAGKELSRLRGMKRSRRLRRSRLCFLRLRAACLLLLRMSTTRDARQRQSVLLC